jgi:catechol 2,3-dioxygenase-like lactoylglutathione lyase family enzyme
MFDVAATVRFYCDYLGCTLDFQEGDGEGPTYLQVSRDSLVVQISSHHGDGTPGTAVLVYTEDLIAFHQELHDKRYPFLNPGIEPHRVGRVMTVLDPASNLIRFFQRDR